MYLNANMIWERIKAYHGRASGSVRPVKRLYGQEWGEPTPASGGMEDGRSRYAALAFPIIAVLCGKIKEQCLEREGRVGKFGFSGEIQVTRYKDTRYVKTLTATPVSISCILYLVSPYLVSLR